MTKIGNVDQVMLLLQQQLQKLNSAPRKASSQKAGKAGEAVARTSLRRLSSIAPGEGLSDDDFSRALIRALLVDELGDALAEDHRFDRMAAEIHRLLSSDDKTAALLVDAARQARDLA